MKLKQLSVFVENKCGGLSEVTTALARNNIDIRALSMADSTDFGVLRLIVADPGRAEAILKAAGFTVSQTNVIALGVDDRPGGLAEALEVITAGGIGVEYLYAFVSRDKNKAYVLLRLDDNEKGEGILRDNGFTPVTSNNLI